MAERLIAVVAYLLAVVVIARVLADPVNGLIALSITSALFVPVLIARHRNRKV